MEMVCPIFLPETVPVEAKMAVFTSLQASFLPGQFLPLSLPFFAGVPWPGLRPPGQGFDF